ncbi:MAG: alcohol dehydrogenase [Nevskia sp.]|nr:alcohol dehydrogenase [Nevskia sp.]
MKTKLIAIGVLLLLALSMAFLQRHQGEDSAEVALPTTQSPQEVVARGQYLAQLGDCVVCHTARGGAPFAGGEGVPTPFGKVFGPNITADAETGIGDWSADDFWQALHLGKSKDGHFLYPAFPYTDYTRINRADADALFAYLKSLPPVRQASREPELRFPYNLRPLLVVWRALYFKPGVYRADAQQSDEWNRGAYLVQGPGHCAACHSPRNSLGGTERDTELAGAVIPVLDWYAPPLNSDLHAGVGGWEREELSALLKVGISNRGVASGPMAEVVYNSLQHLSQADVQAISVYLKTLPAKVDGSAGRGAAGVSLRDKERVMTLGSTLYEKHCADCHKSAGTGIPPAYPPLAGNIAVSGPFTINLIRMVLNGGFPPGTGGNPRPYGMPPFGEALNDEQAAAVLTYVRNSWGNEGAPISPAEVSRNRGAAVN